MTSASASFVDDLVAYADALFMRWHQGLREGRHRQMDDLHRQKLGAAGRAFYRLKIYEDTLSVDVRERVRFYKAVADEYGCIDLLSESRIEKFRETIMTTVGFACMGLKDHNERDFLAAGESGPPPEAGRYDTLKGRILTVVNSELKPLEIEGRVRAHRSATSDIPVDQHRGSDTFDPANPRSTLDHAAADASAASESAVHSQRARRTDQIAGDDETNVQMKVRPKFLRRAAWLHDQLRDRDWNVHDLQRAGGPDWKTTKKILDGLTVRAGVLEKVTIGLSAGKNPKLKVMDIPEA